MWIVGLLVQWLFYVDIASQIRLFADDCFCYHKMKTVEDTLKLQKGMDHFGSLAGVQDFSLSNAT